MTVHGNDGEGRSAATCRPLRRLTARRGWAGVLCLALALFVAPPAAAAQPAPVVEPRAKPPAAVPAIPPATVRVVDDVVESAALGRRMPYRVLLPAGYDMGMRRYPVLYLLHGLTGAHSDWESRTRLADHLRPFELVVVMPEGQNSWYADAAANPADKFETYIQDDLIADVQKKYRVLATRHGRAIAGLSMGGYGAMKFALKRPDRFVVAGSLSGALGAARPPASPDPARTEPPTPFQRTVQESMEAAFGPPGSPGRTAHDLFALVEKADPARLPYLYLDCGTEDGLLEVNREFTALLRVRKIAYEYHEVPGAHTWDYWDRQAIQLLHVLARGMQLGRPPTH